MRRVGCVKVEVEPEVMEDLKGSSRRRPVDGDARSSQETLLVVVGLEMIDTFGLLQVFIVFLRRVPSNNGQSPSPEAQTGKIYQPQGQDGQEDQKDEDDVWDKTNNLEERGWVKTA
ncbi:hypothetical protein TWF481_011795 [Arthrobotrys musiformis]|uniref:Uncharacterized protein n=1 Tax=Arthrobotrys musiformis TaxID=47236 RepID=A0AAV9VV42_9PEZI